MNITLVNRIKRTAVVIFLRKISWILILISILLISFLLGVWNIQSFEYVNSNKVYVNDIDTYVSEYIGSNIFLIQPKDIENDILSSNSYVKSVNIEKILPNKILVTVNEYIPKYVGYFSNRCVLFSIEGKELEEYCKDCENECLEHSNILNSIYIKSDTLLSSESKLIFLDEISSISALLYEFGYDIKSVDISQGVTVIQDTFDHSFTFDITYDLDTQLSRLYLVGEKINAQEINFSSVDLRFERPVMKLIY